MAYEPKVAAALSGVTTSRLAYWRTTEVLIPEVSANKPVLYSFRDLVALRTFAYLREMRSLQSIRRAPTTTASGTIRMRLAASNGPASTTSAIATVWMDYVD